MKLRGNEGQQVKRAFPKGGYQWDGGEDKERVNEGEYCGCILYSRVKNRIMKIVEIVLRRG
jgi:hypothetical protein